LSAVRVYPVTPAPGVRETAETNSLKASSLLWRTGYRTMLSNMYTPKIVYVVLNLLIPNHASSLRLNRFWMPYAILVGQVESFELGIIRKGFPFSSLKSSLFENGYRIPVFHLMRRDLWVLDYILLRTTVVPFMFSSLALWIKNGSGSGSNFPDLLVISEAIFVKYTGPNSLFQLHAVLLKEAAFLKFQVTGKTRYSLGERGILALEINFEATRGGTVWTWDLVWTLPFLR
jgi:hypothetical protein